MTHRGSARRGTSRLRAVIALALCLVSGAAAYATVSAVVVIYQPILTAGDATAIKTPKGFAVMAMPFECFPYHGHPPYSAIALTNPLLSTAPESGRMGEANLAAMAGIKIETPFEENTVVIHLENLAPVEAFEMTGSSEDIVEAVIECVRRMAVEGKEHPKLCISPKPGEDRKWALWEKAFHDRNLREPFKRPPRG